MPADAVQKTVTINGVDFVVALDPVRVDGELALVSLKVVLAESSVASGAPAATLPSLTHLWRDPYLYPGAAVGAGLRVLDLPAGQVLLAATTSRGGALTDVRGATAKGLEFIAIIGVPSSDQVDVLLPSAGLVTGVPVVRDGGAGIVASTLADFGIDADPADAVVRSYVLSEYRTSPSEDFRVTRTGDDVEVSLSADVLFPYNKAELTAKADARLRTVGAQIVAAGAGELSVVGHTDDSGGTADNQKLSVRRARAVADRLKKLVDLGSVTVSAAGVGESQPAVAGTSASARALNRRVELKYRAANAGTSTTTATALPTTAGETGTAVEGVTVVDRWSKPYTSWTVKVDRVTRKDGYLIGELTVTLESGAEQKAQASILGSGNFDSRGSWNPELAVAVTRVSLLTADTRTYPVQYVPEAARKGEASIQWPLADTFLVSLVRGQPRTVTVIWPDVAGAEVTLDAAPPRWLIEYAAKGYGVDEFLEDQPSFRLTGARVTG